MENSAQDNIPASGFEDSESVVTATVVKPRIWTVLLSFPIAFGIYSFVQTIPMIVIAIIIAATQGGENGPENAFSPENIENVMMNPKVLLPGLLTGQLALVAMSVGAGVLSPNTLRDRLRLKPIGLPIWAVGCMAIGTLFISGCYMVLFGLLGFEPSEHLQRLSSSMTGLSLPVFLATVLVIGIMPGFGEEFLFRGYIQTRLLERWSPFAAILFTSSLFAIMHIDPQHMTFALVLGIWCGLVAWRTGSLWPAVLCHATNNTLSVFMSQFSDSASTMELTLINWLVPAISLPCFLVSLYYLVANRNK